MEKILLIVNPEDAIWMTDILQPQGFKVDYVADAMKGLDIMQQIAYDLVVLDMELSSVRSTYAARLLAKSGADHQVSMVAVTADTSKEMRQCAFKFGYQSVIHKPINRNGFRHQVVRCLLRQTA